KWVDILHGPVGGIVERPVTAGGNDADIFDVTVFEDREPDDHGRIGASRYLAHRLGPLLGELALERLGVPRKALTKRVAAAHAHAADRALGAGEDRVGGAGAGGRTDLVVNFRR